jgi:hypothetical protein
VATNHRLTDDGSRRTIASRVRKARAVGRDVGAAGMVFRVAQRLVPDPPIHLAWFVVLGTPPRTAQRMDGTDGRRWATDDDRALLTQFGERPEVVDQRLARGARAAIHADGDELLAHLWVSRGTYEENGAAIRLREDERWFFDGMVAPAHRGRRLHPLLFAAMTGDLAVDGVRGIYSTTDHLNVASIRSSRARGAVVHASVLVIQIGAFTLRRDGWVGRRARWHRGRGRLEMTLPPA